MDSYPDFFPPYVAQLKTGVIRKRDSYKVDFAYPELKLIIEVDGGTHGRGAHSTGVGIFSDHQRDVKHYLELGWITFRYTTDSFYPETVGGMKKEAIEQLGAILEHRRKELCP